jgi:hypothetical protein
MYRDIEKCFEAGWSDGLPVIPPYESLVKSMLSAMGWGATDVIGTIPAQHIEIRAEHLAATAVMAGCKVDYGPVLRSLSEALVDPGLNISGTEVTTGGAALLVIVSGPVVTELGFEYATNALGANVRANATVGRFAEMVRLFCGRGGGALESHGTLGHPGRLSFCIAERPQPRWAPFHTQFGVRADASVVTVMATEGPNSVNSHYCKSGRAVLETISDCAGHAGITNFYYRMSGSLIVIGPEHMDLVSEEFTREAAAEFVFEHSVRPTDWLNDLGRIPRDPRRGSKVEFGTMRSAYDNVNQLSFIECGAYGGKFSAVIPRWVGNRKVISRQIETATVRPLARME